MSLAVLQPLLDLFSAPSYLEIGVFRGQTFHGLRANLKVAVDPGFAFDHRPEPAPGCSVTYHEVPSDVYFGSIVSTHHRFDVIYLDGLHTFEQTLRDLINALSFLSPGGVIVIDDIRPNSYAASLPKHADCLAVKAFLGTDSNTAWMGDVFKLAFFIDTFFQQFSFATVQENSSQLVMWRRRRPAVHLREIGEFARLQFQHCVTEMSAFNLMPLGLIVEAVREAISAD